MLTDETRSMLKPLLGPIARKVNARMPLQSSDLEQMLVPCGLQQNPEALDELKTWYVLLRRLQIKPTAENREQTRDALLARGLPIAPAWLAVDLAATSRPQPHTSRSVSSASASQPRHPQRTVSTHSLPVKSVLPTSISTHQNACPDEPKFHPMVFFIVRSIWNFLHKY